MYESRRSREERFTFIPFKKKGWEREGGWVVGVGEMTGRGERRWVGFEASEEPQERREGVTLFDQRTRVFRGSRRRGDTCVETRAQKGREGSPGTRERAHDE